MYPAHRMYRTLVFPHTMYRTRVDVKGRRTLLHQIRSEIHTHKQEKHPKGHLMYPGTPTFAFECGTFMYTGTPTLEFRLAKKAAYFECFITCMYGD